MVGLWFGCIRRWIYGLRSQLFGRFLPHVGVFIISVQGLKLEVTQIIGPVVDVQLKSSVPAWRIPTPVRVAQSIRAGHVTVEVQHLLGGGIFRSVAMQGTQGLRRGDPAELLPGLGSAVEPLDPSAWHVTCSGKRVWRLESSTAREAYPGDVSHHHLALGIVALLLSHMLSVASLYLWLLDVGSWSVIRVLVALLLASS